MARGHLPIFGPLLGTGMLFLAGLVSFDTIWQAPLLAATYLIIHIVEEAITPILLARRFTLNPVLVIISIVFWNWKWGVGGGAAGGPVARNAQDICDRIRSLAAFGHFLGAEARN